MRVPRPACPEYGPKSGPLRLAHSSIALEVGQSGIWAEVWPVETMCVRESTPHCRPEYGPKSGPLRLSGMQRAFGTGSPEYGPKSGPLRLSIGLLPLAGSGSGIWAEVWPVETILSSYLP